MNVRSILKKRWFVYTLEILFFVLMYFALRAYMQRDIVSGTVPQLKAITLEQQVFDLHADKRRPLLLHFWATWCGICKLEQGSIDSLSKDYNVMTVAMTSGSDQEVQSYLKEHGLGFKVINDESGELSQSFGVSGVPASFVIDEKNQIRFSEVGYTTGWGLRFRLWLAD